MEWWPFLIFHRGGLRIKVINNNIHRLLHRFQPKPWRKKRQDFSAFALTYILRLSSCRVMGDFVISPLPRLLTKELCAAGPLCSTGVAPFQRYYGPSRHRLVFDRFPGASGYAVYLAPSISRRDEDGFSSCLACPCHRAVPTTPPQGCASSDSLATHPVAFVRHEKTRPLGSIFLSGPPMGSLVLFRFSWKMTVLKIRYTHEKRSCHEQTTPSSHRRAALLHRSG